MKSTYAKVHGTEKKQKNQLVVKCTTRRSKLLTFIFRKKKLCDVLVKKENY